MDKASAISILNSLKVIETSGAVTAKVTNAHPYTREDGTSGVIHSFNLINRYGVSEASRLMAEGDVQEACNQNLTSFQRDGKDDQFSKGAHVQVIIGEVEVDGGVALLPVSVQPVPEAKVSRMTFGSEDVPAPKESDVTDEPKSK